MFPDCLNGTFRLKFFMQLKKLKIFQDLYTILQRLSRDLCHFFMVMSKLKFFNAF